MEKEKSGPSVRERVDLWWEEKRFRIYTAILLILLTVAFFWNRMIVSVPAGHHAVKYRRFSGGTVTNRIWGEGQHIILPWDSLNVYETRVQERTTTFPVLSRDGMEILVTVSVRFHPIVGNLGFLHREIGPDYFPRFVWPEVESNLRRTVGDRSAYELYSTEGDILQEAAQITIKVKQAAAQYVRVDDILLRRIQLPEVVREAINEKHRQEQILLAYEFRVKREEREAERKRIEASGIRDYNIIADRISPQLLRWRGIDATLALAQSPNSKIIIIGGGKDGLPIILDTKSEGAAPAAAGTEDVPLLDLDTATNPPPGPGNSPAPVTGGSEPIDVEAPRPQ